MLSPKIFLDYFFGRSFALSIERTYDQANKIKRKQINHLV